MKKFFLIVLLIMCGSCSTAYASNIVTVGEAKGYRYVVDLETIKQMKDGEITSVFEMIPITTQTKKDVIKLADNKPAVKIISTIYFDEMFEWYFIGNKKLVDSKNNVLREIKNVYKKSKFMLIKEDTMIMNMKEIVFEEGANLYGD